MTKNILKINDADFEENRVKIIQVEGQPDISLTVPVETDPMVMNKIISFNMQFITLNWYGHRLIEIPDGFAWRILQLEWPETWDWEDATKCAIPYTTPLYWIPASGSTKNQWGTLWYPIGWEKISMVIPESCKYIYLLQSSGGIKAEENYLIKSLTIKEKREIKIWTRFTISDFDRLYWIIGVDGKTSKIVSTQNLLDKHNNGDYCWVVMPANDLVWKTIRVKTNENYGGCICCLQDYPCTSNNDITFNPRKTLNLTQMEKDTEYTYTIPAWTNYLYFLWYHQNGDLIFPEIIEVIA